MLSVTGQRWYFVMGLECNRTIVDTLSWRGLATSPVGIGFAEYTSHRGKPHCLDGPAWAIGDERHWYMDGQLHRLDGPAKEGCRSNQFLNQWYKHGLLHRSDGPAIYD